MIVHEGEIYAIGPQFRASLTEALQVREPAPRQLGFLEDGLEDGDRMTLVTTLPQQGVAVMRIQGAILRDSRWFPVTWQTIRADLEFLQQRESVSGVVLVLDTPGGAEMGCQEICDLIDNFGKPITAFVAGYAMSAGYRIACHCDAIYATQSAAIGGIGTMINLLDRSKQYAAEGLEVVSLSTAPLKTIGVEGLPITEEQRAFLMSRVVRMQQAFGASLSKRGLTGQQQSVISDGRYWDAAEALQLGMIDGIKPISEVIGGMVPPSGVRSPSIVSAGHQEGSDMTKAVSDPPAVDAGQQTPVVTTAVPATAAVQSISIAEIEQLCPGADPAFILQQAKIPGVTEVGVLKAFSAHQQQQIVALQAEQKLDATLKTAPAGSNAVSQSAASGSQKNGIAGDVISQFEMAIEEAVKGGAQRSMALSTIVTEQPELHQSYLTALRSLTPEQKSARRQRNASRVLSRDFAASN